MKLWIFKMKIVCLPNLRNHLNFFIIFIMDCDMGDYLCTRNPDWFFEMESYNVTQTGLKHPTLVHAMPSTCNCSVCPCTLHRTVPHPVTAPSVTAKATVQGLKLLYIYTELTSVLFCIKKEWIIESYETLLVLESKNYHISLFYRVRSVLFCFP